MNAEDHDPERQEYQAHEHLEILDDHLVAVEDLKHELLVGDARDLIVPPEEVSRDNNDHRDGENQAQKGEVALHHQHLADQVLGVEH